MAKVQLKESSVPVIVPWGGISKSAPSGFLKNDSPSGSYSHLSNPEMTIVIHPGSRYLKIGKAKAAFPKVIPQCIAYLNEMFPSGMFNDDVHSAAQLAEDEFNERLSDRYSKDKGRKKLPPNMYANLRAFNDQQSTVKQSIPLHNDSFGIEWLDVKNLGHVTGASALRISPDIPHSLHWPLINGRFNERDYATYRGVLGDLDKIWTNAIASELGIGRMDIKHYTGILIIDDQCEGWEIKAYCELALKLIGFKAIAFLKTSQAASFGAGVSSALVIDFGAEKTSIGCIEDGVLVPGSSVVCPVGGDDVVSLFFDMLRVNHFPVQLDLNAPLDYEMVENELFTKLMTMDDQQIVSTTVEFFQRHPGQDTSIQSVKVCDERVLPLSELLQPGMPLLKRYSDSRANGRSKFGHEVTFVTATRNESTTNQEGGDSSGNELADDVEIEPDVSVYAEEGFALPDYVQKSLSVLGTPERVQKCASATLIIGGAIHQFPMAKDHLLLSTVPDMELLFGGLKETAGMDPRYIAWKGGAVLAKLEGVCDCWIDGNGWECRGERLLADRLSFPL